MKRILTLLLRKAQPPWWELHESTGDPPEERSYMFDLPALITVIRAKLHKTETNHESGEDH